MDNSVSTYAYNEKNQLLSMTGGGVLRFRGTLNEPGTVTVNGQPAQMLAGNTFEAYVNVPTVPTTVPVVATDTSGNATTKSYEVSGAGAAATFAYDLNGNLIQKVEGSDTWTYEWNAENQLTRVRTNGVEVARYAYDPSGRRVERTANATTTLWSYQDRDILRETSSGTATQYSHGPGVDEPLAQEDSSGVLAFLHADGLGSVVRITDATGSAASSRRFDAFGKPEVGPTDGYGFTAREWDGTPRLAYHRARYYDPTMGRFVSEDPVRFRGGSNFYVYALGNPVNARDPLGLETGRINDGFMGPYPPFAPTCQPNCCMKRCLERIMGTLPEMDVVPNSSIYTDTAVSSPGGIAIPGSCFDFYHDLLWTLHEYYHVVFQWRTGRMTYPGYGAAAVWGRITRGDFHDNTYERAADRYAERMEPVLRQCIKECR